jgi:hypothetical protein
LHEGAGLNVDLVHTSALRQWPFTDAAFPMLITGERYTQNAAQVIKKVAGVPFERNPNLSGLGHFVQALASASV